ncbi:hypothetical protein E2C01_045280 [Portunus trituberculatus]|uniref:Uncharacterized protein n=1 Tax=Portunus trituberculatus TaxID=210409 RepID=A0A5B7G4M2_PORTR|nr:hypothetical protein [Portunus trituberculatus]
MDLHSSAIYVTHLSGVHASPHTTPCIVNGNGITVRGGAAEAQARVRLPWWRVVPRECRKVRGYREIRCWRGSPFSACTHSSAGPRPGPVSGTVAVLLASSLPLTHYVVSVGPQRGEGAGDGAGGGREEP